MGLTARLACACFCLIAQVGAAQDTALLRDWRDWLITVGATEATMAVWHDGRVITVVGQGLPADTTLPVMSLSKAVTGACVMALVDEGVLELDDTLAHWLVDRTDLLDPDAPTGKITIGALLTHASGLRPDSTQTPIYGLLISTQRPQFVAAKTALRRQRAAPSFFYNNENYAILHFVIEAVTGAAPEDACWPRVFEKRSGAVPHETYGGALSYAGWGLTAKDLIRFGTAQQRRKDWPSSLMENGGYYGAGLMYTDDAYADLIWHDGVICIDGHDPVTTLFYHLPGQFAVATILNTCLVEDDFVAFGQDVFFNNVPTAAK